MPYFFFYAKSKNRSFSTLALGFMLLIAFNFSQRMSMIAGNYYKTFDVAWMLSLLLIIFGFAGISKESIKSITFHQSNSIFVFISGFLSVFTTIVFATFIFFNYAISSFEAGSSESINFFFENLPSILIFSYVISMFLGKAASEKIYHIIMKIIYNIKSIGSHTFKESKIFEDNVILEEGLINEIIVETRHKVMAASKAKSDFLMNMSHDFRTPASGISSMSRLIHERISDPKIKYLQSLVAQSSRALLNIIDSTLEYTRYADIEYLAELKPINVYELVDHVVALMLPAATEKGLIIRTTYNIRKKVFYTDYNMIRNILINLISNSIKFTHKGEIIISTCKDVGGNLIVSVKDTGVGIHPDEVNKIYDPFYSVDISDKSEIKQKTSIGLGLSTIKKILEKIEGKINLETSVGKGSCFTLILKNNIGS